MHMDLVKKPRTRCALLDTLRGLTVLSMVLYHAAWDLVYMFGVDWDWYYGKGAYFWQQSICCTFILLSGFCAGMSKKPLKRGLMVSGLGLIVTLVTVLFMPENRVVFGVLTLIGACMLLMIPLKPLLKRVNVWAGLAGSLGLFLFTRHINQGYLGLGEWELIQLPDFLYQNYVTTFFGFMHKGFYSTDYFSLFPWVFLFLAGFFLHKALGKFLPKATWKGIRLFNFIGRHALEIYAVHQPLIYGLCLVWDMLR
ncbi:MAG: DUF1624 domain-containing protein [Oscillospiraceae bacterium]|nr:DUF1624 domain-containing protein [Oscillospiraceae bacterium]